MKQITYKVTDELGVHARPAGQLVKAATGFACKVTVGVGAKTVDAKRIMGVMGLGAKKGDTITLTFDGADEAVAATALEKFLRETL